MLNYGLTKQQKKFADEFIINGRNATEAYKLAGYKVNNDNSAATSASRLLKNAKVSAYIEKRLEQLDLESLMSQKEVLQRLARVGRREEKETVVVTLKTKESKFVDGKKQMVETEKAELVEIPAKLADTNKALELIGKHHKTFTDKQEIAVTLPVFVNNIPPEDDPDDG